MASSLLWLVGAGSGTLSGGGPITAFGGLANGACGYSNNTSEAPFQHKCAAAGTLSNLYVNVTTNTRNGTAVYTVRLNAADTSITTTHNSGVTGIQVDTTHSASVAVDDLLSAGIGYNGNSGNLGIAGVGLRFNPTGGTAVPYQGVTTSTGITFSGTSVNVYAPLAGRLSGVAAAENDTRLNIPYAGTAKYTQLYVGTNGRSTDTVVTLRKNTGSGNQTKTYTAGTTGLLVDTSNTDNLAAGDLVDLQIALGTGTGNFIVLSTGFWVSSTIEGQTATGSGDTTPVTMAAGATTFNVFGGRLGVSTTESITQHESGTAAAATSLWVNVINNTSITSAVTVFRKNSGTGNQAVTLTALTTGPFQDTTHTDTFVATDLINAQTNNVTTGAITVSVMSMMLWTSVSNAITGISGTGSIGTLGVTHKNPLTGIAVTGSLGTLSPIQRKAMTGVSGTGSIGTLGVLHKNALTGISAAGSLGTLTPVNGKAVAVMGVSGTGSLGTLGVVHRNALTGILATGQLGILTPITSGGAVSVALTGIQARGFLGIFSPLGGVQPGGHFIPLTEKQLRELKKKQRKDAQRQDDLDHSRKLDAEMIEADIRATMFPIGKTTIILPELGVVSDEEDESEDLEFILLNA